VIFTTPVPPEEAVIAVDPTFALNALIMFVATVDAPRYVVVVEFVKA
jgi:hypothetical protein